MPRSYTDRCNKTWEELYGTTASGNLPQYKRFDCIEEVVDLDAMHLADPTLAWVDIRYFHYYHMKCPYGDYTTLSGVISGSLNWAQTTVSGQRVRQLVEESDRSEHIYTGGMMIRYSRGSAHGWLCVDPNCPYYHVNGMRYFYI